LTRRRESGEGEETKLRSPPFPGPGALLANYQEPINKRLKTEILRVPITINPVKWSINSEMCTSETCQNRLELYRKIRRKKKRRQVNGHDLFFSK
jgi:hypothetical protein